MDANATRYHLLLDYPDWGRCRRSPQPGDTLRQAWEASPPEETSLAWDPERYELTLEPLLYVYVASPQDDPPRIEDRRGAARDRFGNWYWIDADRRKLRVYSAGSRQVSDFWPRADLPCPEPAASGEFQPVQTPSASPPQFYAGLAVTEEHYLVVGVGAQSTGAGGSAANASSENDLPGLLIFDLHAGGPPQRLYWPAGVDFIPFDMAPMPGGGVWILDRQNRCYWALDRNFDVICRDQELLTLAPKRLEAFQPLGGEEQRWQAPRRFPLGVTLEAASPVEAFDPIAIEALPDCTVLILDRLDGERYSEILRYDFGERLGPPVSTAVMAAHVEAARQEQFRLVAHDFAFVPEHDGPEGRIADRLYVVSSDGNQAFAFSITGSAHTLHLAALAEIYLPVRLFSGKALAASGSEVYYDMGERWVPLVGQRKPRYRPAATFYSPRFDGKTPGCTWHRLLLDACIPPDTEVQIWSRAADLEGDLPAAPWQLERMYLRGDGSELPFVDHYQSRLVPPAIPSNGASAGGAGLAAPGSPVSPKTLPAGSGTWELLFQRAAGRYLELRLALRGQGQRTPRLHAMRLYYPRFSYLEHYVPGVYRQESETASFLERFLANFEGSYTALEDKIAAVRLLFDVDSAPPEALDWLADWFGVALDPTWEDARRRLFIRNALLFFQYRGTPRGLHMALHLALDESPHPRIFSEQALRCARPGELRIVESFLTRRLPGVLFGDPTQLESFTAEPQAPRWSPADGAEALNALYQEAMGAAGPFPLQDPGGAASPAWQAFARQTLGWVPSAHPVNDLSAWKAYLERRYGTVDQLNQAWGLSGSARLGSFKAATLPLRLPTVLPSSQAAVEDWYQFEAVLLPMLRTAHHFSVLLPMPAGAGPDSPEYQRRLGLARKVLDLEKPAHTTYSIKFFWALFRVDEARLGLDTLLGLGGRSPQLLTPFILQQSYLSESYLAAGHPQNVSGRLVLGGGCRPERVRLGAAPSAPAAASQPPSSGLIQRRAC